MQIPEAAIVGFHQDDEGDWVAELACGHTQHVRHQPPLASRPWVVTEEGRRGRVGARLPCRSCLMPKLPSEVREYKRTDVFTADTMPKGLARRHTTKAGVWGEIVVTEGRVLYVVEDQTDPALASFVLHPQLTGTIAPEAPHHVEPQPGARFFVRFLR